MHQNKTIIGILLILLVIVLSSCQGEAGPAGSAGPPGPIGPMGPAGSAGAAGAPGKDGASAVLGVPEFVGSETCAGCHEDIYTAFVQSGHPYKLNKVVNGQPPTYPFSQLSDPPEGYTWDDITYVIGGYGWKARFIDKDGYIITGDENATTQYNLYNKDLDLGDNWVGYHAGEVEKPYNCGTCHTTGYEKTDEHQDGLPGLIGTWAFPGVQCEECHGPASLHVADSTNVNFRPSVSRDSELCGSCHIRGDVTEIDASGAFIKHHEQYEETLQTKHRTLECVDCHDPHASARYRTEEGAVNGIRVECGNCHWEEAAFTPANHPVNDCITCHMARVAKSAVGDTDRLRGDVPSHLFAINPFATEQFYTNEDGAQLSYGFISLPYACTNCHSEGGIATVKTLEELQGMAEGYHARP